MKIGKRSLCSVSARLVLLLSLLAALLAAPPVPSVYAGTITVCKLGCHYQTIQTAINGASNGDIISVTDAVHTEAGITVNRNVTIQGQGVGSTIVQAQTLPHIANSRVFGISNGVTVTIQDLAIRYGNIVASPARGGGIYNNGTLVLRRVAVTNNRVKGLSSGDGEQAFGGGIYNDGTLTIQNSTINGNVVQGGDASGDLNDAGNAYGGGIYNSDSGVLALQTSTTSDNTAQGGNAGGAYGGGGDAYGGGIYNDGGLAAQDSNISGNSAQGGHAAGDDGYAGDAYGGGLAQWASSTGLVPLTNSTISGNTALGGDAKAATSSVGGAYGGGVSHSWSGSGKLEFTNCTISSNVAQGGQGSGGQGPGQAQGGGLRGGNGLALTYCTVAENQALGGIPEGGGLYSSAGVGAGPEVGSSIIAGNSGPPDSDGPDLSHNVQSQDYNLFMNPHGYVLSGATGNNIEGSDPQLGPLQDNGGLTQTHALPQSSSTINRIPNGTNGCGTPVTQDQRGVSRPQDGACDMGSFELEKQGQLEVVKALVPSADPGAFHLQIDGYTERANASNGDSTGKRTVNTGIHTVAELAGEFTDLFDYNSAIKCRDGGGQGSVVASSSDAGPLAVMVNENDDIVCTITNERKTGHLEVVKDLQPDSAPGYFHLQIDGVTRKADASDGDSTGKRIVNTGTHTVAETAGTSTNLADYHSSIECRDDGGQGSVVAGSGDIGPLPVTVNEGDDIVCTITNRRKTGTLEVVKALEPHTDSGKFHLQIDGVTVERNASDGDTSGKETVFTGEYTVGEVDGRDTDLDNYITNIQCRDAGGQGNLVASSNDAGPLPVTVHENDDIVCTIHNTRLGTIVIEKSTQPTGGRGFGFSHDIEPPYSFELDDGQSARFRRLLPGNYHVTETTPAGWYPTSIVCGDPDGGTSVHLGSATASIDLDAGDEIDCTFLNSRRADLSITKSAIPHLVLPGQPITFTLVYSNAGSRSASDVVITDVVPDALNGVEFDSDRLITPKGDIDYTWDVGSLVPQDGGVITLTATISPDLVTGLTFINTASITSTADDGDSSNNDASATVILVRTAPLAVDDYYRVQADTPFESAPRSVLDNDSDLQDDPLEVVLDGGPENGELVLDPDGTFAYTPTLAFVGPDTFSYHANDGELDSNVATVTLIVDVLHPIYLPLVLRQDP